MYNPATGEQQAEVDLASVDEVDAAVAVAKAAFAGVAGRRRCRAAAEVMFRFRELVDANRKEIAALLTAEHGKVLSDALGEVARGLENIEFACGIPHLLKGGYSEQASTASTCTRSASRSAWWPASRRSTSRPWCRCGCSPTRIACGNTFVLKPREKDPSASLFLAELLRQAGLPDGVFNVVQGDKVAVDRLLEHPDVAAVSASSARRRSPATSTRPAPRTASGCRRSAAPRTTWSCCPTPTSTWPPTPPCRPATARRASGAWPSRSWWPSATSADPLVDAISRAARRKLRVGPGTDPTARWAR